MHTIENEELRVMISDHGAELSGIFDKKNNREVLWNADPKYWKRHAPVLFPNVGRLYKDTCLIGGETYTSGQHGFARDMEFICVEETETSVTHTYWKQQMQRRKHGRMNFSFTLPIR